MKSVLLPFYVALELESFPKKERLAIIRYIAEYLLGCVRFTEAKNNLSKYEVSGEFQHVLRSLTPGYQRLYRRNLRSYVLGRETKINDFDRYHLNKLNLERLSRSVKRVRFPSEEEVMHSMSYTINSTAYKFRTNRQLIRMTHVGIDDVKQIMYMRILAAYRTYLPSLGELLPLKAFYAVLHRALSSSLIDKIREFNTKKSQLLVPYASLGNDFELSTDAILVENDKFSPSPEDIIQAKETYFGLLFEDDENNPAIVY